MPNEKFLDGYFTYIHIYELSKISWLFMFTLPFHFYTDGLDWFLLWWCRLSPSTRHILHIYIFMNYQNIMIFHVFLPIHFYPWGLDQLLWWCRLSPSTAPFLMREDGGTVGVERASHLVEGKFWKGPDEIWKSQEW